MLADELDCVIGVDPHRDAHALAVVDVRSGGVVFEATALADGEDYAAATGNSTAPCTRSSCIAASTTRRPRTTSLDGSPKARPAGTPPGCSSAISPVTSFGYSTARSRRWLDKS